MFNICRIHASRVDFDEELTNISCSFVDGGESQLVWSSVGCRDHCYGTRVPR